VPALDAAIARVHDARAARAAVLVGNAASLGSAPARCCAVARRAPRRWPASAARATPAGVAEVRTRRWDDPPRPGEGTRILVCRYRPRGLVKHAETWDEWWRELGPSKELHAAVYGKGQPPIDFAEYRRRFLAEMEQNPARARLRALRDRFAGGETVTLLCSSACTDETRCHRSILRELLLGGGTP
jgi:uncharacterized protein YeaO (DUF488 family)